MDLRNRRRVQLLLIVVIFFVSLAIAGFMMSFGWSPQASSYGTHIRPERDLSRLALQTADGKPYELRNHKAEWTVVALPGPDCARRCLQALDLVRRAQIAMGRASDHVQLVYLGTPPSGPDAAGFDKVWTLVTTSSSALRDLRATAPDSVSAVLVTPSGHAMLSYPAGFDATLLQGDLKRATKVNL